MDRFDIVLAGSGFAGSLMSMIAKRLGYSVLLLEKGRHPRFVIGESSTPLTNLLLEHLAREYDLPRIIPLGKWGTWQSVYPEIACGLKRGFSFFHHKPGEEFTRTPDHRNELLVAASPNDRIADTHWYRPHFDEFFVREAQRTDVEYRDHTSIEQVEFQTTKVLLQTWRDGKSSLIEAKLLIDATGQNSFVQRVLGIPEEELEFMPSTEVLYTHFRNVKRFGEIESVKATSDLYTGVSGTVTAVNSALSDNPGLVNKDPYGQAWMIKVKMTKPNELDRLLPVDEYLKRAGK